MHYKTTIIGGQEFISFDEFLKKKMRNKKFRSGFAEETARLKLAYEMKLLRRKKRMTQKQVAAKVAMPQSVIARIESGGHSVSIDTLQKIANVFNRRVGFIPQR